MTPEWLALLSAMLTGQPHLPGALCVNVWPAFEPPAFAEPHPDVQYRHEVAKRLCASCPSLAACRAWVDALPPDQKPAGITAGKRR